MPQASRDEAAVQGVYGLWDNARISDREILSPHQRRTVERTAGHETVLAIQDAREVEYSDRKATRGLGLISNAKARGLKVHTILAASGDGVLLGLLGQEVWAWETVKRSPKGEARNSRGRAIMALPSQATAEKESQRWLAGLELSQTLVPGEKQLITIADREADIYELFAHPRREGSEFLNCLCQWRSEAVVQCDRAECRGGRNHVEAATNTATTRAASSIERAAWACLLLNGSVVVVVADV